MAKHGRGKVIPARINRCGKGHELTRVKVFTHNVGARFKWLCKCDGYEPMSAK